MKKENIPVEKNKDYTLEIVGTAHEGEGIGKIDNFTIFVQGAIIGELVEVKIVKVNKNFAYGKLLNIITPSPNRVEPVCNIYKRCGGCNIQHMSYDAQLNFKTQKVKDTINRIGKIDDIVIHDTIGMDNPYNYRNKVQLPVGRDSENVKIGFYAPRSHEIINMETCHIQDTVADEVAKLTKQWIKDYNIKTYNEMDNSGVIRHIMVRKAFKTGEVMVVLVTNTEKLPYKEEFINYIINNVNGIVSIIQNINTKNTNVILGDKCISLWGKDTITDYIGDFKFNISPLSFFQVNSVQTGILYSKALEYAELTGEEVVFDAYCGTGTISLFLSEKAKKVYGVEIIPEAIKNAKVNAKENEIYNTEFIVGKAEEVIPKLISEGTRADVVVVDPPRKGCEKELLEAISEMEPLRIVYVSCDSSTLARDLNILQTLGYKTLEIQPVDMFPQTAHVENVAKLIKNK